MQTDSDTVDPDSGSADTGVRGHWPTTLAVVGWTLVALGVASRVVRFLDGRSLWLDEATLSLEILGRSFAELAEPLGRNQAAPLVFLWLQKLATQCFGDGERALRAVPFAAGLLAVPWFWRLARRWFDRPAALLALVSFSISESLVFYCAEAKQYSLDVLVAVVVLDVGAWAWQRGLSGIALGVLPVVCAAALVTSQPSVFLVAMLVVVFGARACRWVGEGGAVRSGGASSERPGALVLAVSVAVIFGLLYWFLLRPSMANETLQHYWASDYLPLPTSFDGVLWYPQHLLGFFNDPCAWPAAELAALCFILGTFGGRESGRWLWLVVPFGLVLLAAALRLYPFPGSFVNQLTERIYPFVGRTLLFLLPIATLGVAAGIRTLCGGGEERPTSRRIGAALVVALLFCVPILQMLENLVSPPRIQELRPLWERVHPEIRADDWIFAQTYAGPVLEYYHRRSSGAAGDQDRPWVPIPASTTSDEGRRRFRDALAQLQPGQRLWLFSLHHPRWSSREEQFQLLAILQQRARPVATYEEYRSSAVLLEALSSPR